MSLQIGTALRDGATQLLSRTGAILIAAYLVVYTAYMVAFNGLINDFYRSLEGQLPPGQEVPQVQPALDVSQTVNGAIVAACMLLMTYVSIVAVRTFVAGERDSIPGEFLTDGIAWAVLNMLVGGTVFMLLWLVGLVALVVPGIFLFVSLIFMAVFVAVEGENFVTAMRHSWALAKGDRFAIFGLLLVVFAIAMAGGLAFSITSSIATAVGFEALGTVLTMIVSVPLSMYNIAVIASAYNQLRETNHGLGGPSASDGTATSPA